MNKPQVRELAREHHLALAEKPDSQEICFVPGGDYKRFIDAYLSEQGEQLPDTSGELVTTDGKVLGHHEGVHNFTVGQRKGLGVATGSPLYVININGAEGKVTVGGNDDLLSRTLIARDLNWIAIDGLHDSGPRPTRPCALQQRSAIAMSLRQRCWRTLPTAKCALRSTSRSAPSRRDRPWCFTRTIWSSAADGLQRRPSLLEYCELSNHPLLPVLVVTFNFRYLFA